MKHLRLLYLLLDEALGAWSSSGIHHMSPVTHLVLRQLSPPLHQQNTGVANLAESFFLKSEALLKILLVSGAVGESGAENSRMIMQGWFVCWISHLLDLALQIQQPSPERNIFGLWKLDILLTVSPRLQISKVLQCYKYQMGRCIYKYLKCYSAYNY